MSCVCLCRDFYDADLTGTLPPEWGSPGALPSLTSLKLSYNRISGAHASWLLAGCTRVPAPMWYHGGLLGRAVDVRHGIQASPLMLISRMKSAHLGIKI